MAMVKAPFNGQLNSNEIFGSIYNMIISQQIFADNIKGIYGELVGKVKTDGSMYGDTKLFYATDVLKSRPWLNDLEASNLLAINRPNDPECQAITLDQFRQIDITVDNYLSKRAWGNEGAFSNFNSVILGWIRTTKQIYEATLINSYMGTVETAATKNLVEIAISDVVGDTSGEEANKLEAMAIAQGLADLFVDMKDVSRDYNDYKFLRSYDLDDLYVVWNSKFVNKIRKVDLPTIFHKDGLIDKFEEHILPSRYFGVILTADDADSNGVIENNIVVADKGVRSLVEKDITVSSKTYHVFPGDLIPAGATVGGSSQQFKYDETYKEDENIICKIFHRDSVKFMSAFEVGTSFFNPRSLTENHYLTWGYSKPDYLKNYPIVSVHKD